MRRAARALALALVAAGCGGGGGAGPPIDPVAIAEDPAAVLANSQYPELPPDGVKATYLLDTGDHLTHVLSFVDGLRIDEEAATEALRYFEQLRQEVPLGVDGESTTLVYRVRPRNYPQRYVVVVPDGAPLPLWAGPREAGRSFVSSRPVNVDHAVTLIRVAEKPFTVGSPFDTMPVATQLDTVFLSEACARSASITTDEDAAYRFGSNIHNQGESVICNAESRLLTGRRLGMSGTAMAGVVAANRAAANPAAANPAAANPAAAGAGRRPALVLPPFDQARYDQLPKLEPIFSVA
ncbi:MAG: hypothetical protein ACRD1D_12310 [Acidimicrobiales bacterium]